MRGKQSLDTRSFLYAVVIHLVALVLLVVSVEFDIFSAKKPKQQIVQATVIDRTQIEKELNQPGEAEERKQKEEAHKRREADEKARVEQEKRKALAIKKAEAEERRIEEKRKEEKKRKAEKEKRKQAEALHRKEEAEKQRKEEEARRKVVEEEKRRVEERRRKEEAEKRRKKEEARRQAEEAKKHAEKQRREEENARRQQALLDELAVEEAEATQHQDERVISAAVAEIQNKVGRSFNKTGLPSGLTCKIRIRTVPGGEVVSAEVTRSSGNALFDRQAEIAAQKASPLPVATDTRVYESYFRMLDLEFKP